MKIITHQRPMLAVLGTLLVVAAVCATTTGGFQRQPVALPDSLPPGVSPQMIEIGYTVFHGTGMCVNCHGENASGLLGPDLTDSDWWHTKGSYLSIVQRVLDGVSESESVSGAVMPAKGGMPISDEDVLAVSAYVWRLSHAGEDELPLGVVPKLVERGRDVFGRADGCSRCHGAAAHGEIGPDLTDDAWLHAKGSYLAIVKQIVIGVPAEKSRTGVIMPPRGGSHMSDGDLHAVAAYVWVISRKEWDKQ